MLGPRTLHGLEIGKLTGRCGRPHLPCRKKEVVSGITGKTHDISQDVEIIQGALADEHAGIAAYRIAGGSGFLVPDTLKVTLPFKSHHEGHRDALAKLISDVDA